MIWLFQNNFLSLQTKTNKQIKNMVKGTYKMNIEIEYEFDDEEITAVDATDLIDYFAETEVKLDDWRVNILNVNLSPIND